MDIVRWVNHELTTPRLEAKRRPTSLFEIDYGILRALVEMRRPPTGETPARRSARKRRMDRLMRDETQAAELALLIRSGDTTEQARQKMKLGVVRAQRIRALAVKLGLLSPRQRGPGTP